METESTVHVVKEFVTQARLLFYQDQRISDAQIHTILFLIDLHLPVDDIGKKSVKEGFRDGIIQSVNISVVAVKGGAVDFRFRTEILNCNTV